MSHLTEEQLEDILQGRAEAPAHVDRCPPCRACLEEKQALTRSSTDGRPVDGHPQAFTLVPQDLLYAQSSGVNA